MAIQISRNKQFQNTWVKTNVVKWGTKCCAKVRLNCHVLNKEVLDSLDWNRNVFLVANHQSYLDIPAIYVATRKMVGFLAKYGLSKVPFLNFWMKIQGCVFINRTRYITAIKTMQNMKLQKQVVRLVLFPEGTRSKNGKLGKFKSGALKIAWQLDGILIPTTIQGTRQAWEDRDKILYQYPAQIRFDKVIDCKMLKTTHTFNEFFSQFEHYFKMLHEKSSLIR